MAEKRNMVKEKPNSTRTYDEDGFRRRAACLCFRDASEDEVSLIWFLTENGKISVRTPVVNVRIRIIMIRFKIKFNVIELRIELVLEWYIGLWCCSLYHYSREIQVGFLVQYDLFIIITLQS